MLTIDINLQSLIKKLIKASNICFSVSWWESFDICTEKFLHYTSMHFSASQQILGYLHVSTFNFEFPRTMFQTITVHFRETMIQEYCSVSFHVLNLTLLSSYNYTLSGHRSTWNKNSDGCFFYNRSVGVSLRAPQLIPGLTEHRANPVSM